jgi:hypothetical protein
MRGNVAARGSRAAKLRFASKNKKKWPSPFRNP